MPKSHTLSALALVGLTLLTARSRADHHAETPPTPAERIQAIEHAHHVATYEKQSAIKADMVIDFGPMHVEGTMWFTPSMGKVRMELDGGTVIVFDGQTAWLSPADAAVPGPPARFHVLTWPYFVAVPYKLDDPGTHHTDTGPHPIRGDQERLLGVKITFDAGVGDTPDDWYMSFADPDTGRLTALSYIVTYGTPTEEANKKPSIVLYDDFVEVAGVPFATTWTFHFWNPDTGIDGEPKGTAKLSDISFVTPPDDAFVKPAGAVEAKAPGE
ncbi:MAG: hypothetical protein AAF333_06685 [Planctomycetota bacterium]